MSSSITFGRYSQSNSFTHKLDPRNKLFLSIALVVAIFLPFTLETTKLIMSGAYLLAVIIFMIISRVSFLKLLNNLKGMWFLVIFIFAIYLFIPNSAYNAAQHPESTFLVAFSLPYMDVTWNAIFDCIYIILRLIIMMALMMVLTTTTKPMDLTYAFEWYMTPLKAVKFPAHEIAMTLSIALRFIPTLLEETTIAALLVPVTM